MKVASIIVVAGLLAFIPVRAAVTIIHFDNSDGTLVWTNSFSNATYRVESTTTPLNAWSWTALSNLSSLQSTGYSATVQVPKEPSERAFYRIVWTDASAADPIGTWEYEGFEGSSLVVTGLLSITATNPITGSCIFGVVGNPPQTKHPTGSASFADGTMEGANAIIIPVPLPSLTPPTLRGQMVLDEFYGEWSYRYRWSTIGGRFVAKKRRN